ncbi:MAG: hypothetical protein ACTSWA_09090, partial [Candidatus Thorarchaeota archaeon]
RDVKRPWRGRKTFSWVFRDLQDAASMKQEPNISRGHYVQDWVRFGQRLKKLGKLLPDNDGETFYWEL